MPRATKRCGVDQCESTLPCATHTRVRYPDLRPSSAARGYGSKYRKVRDQAVAGQVICPRCNRPYTPENPATGGHVVPQREGGSLEDGVVAQCRRCNYGWRRTGT